MSAGSRAATNWRRRGSAAPAGKAAAVEDPEVDLDPDPDREGRPHTYDEAFEFFEAEFAAGQEADQ